MMRHRSQWSLCLYLLALLPGFITVSAEETPPLFTILFSAESHAALLPCDCPLRLIGGLARRATLIQRYRERGPVLLLDAGNWAAGGIYDEESDGRFERDALRTELMARAMQSMHYDIAARGQAEALWLRADSDLRDALMSRLGTALLDDTAPRILSANGIKVGVAVVREDASIAEQEASTAAISTLPPIPGADFVVVLSQQGEERTSDLVGRNSHVDFAVNAGRKESTRPYWMSGNTKVANFDYQTQQLGVAEVYRDPQYANGWDIRVTFIPLTREIPEDPEMLALLRPHLEMLQRKGKRHVAVEVFMNAECPYSCELAPDLARIARDLKNRVEIVPHFAVRKQPDGSFKAPHGERELQENRIQSLVQRYYPERFWEWLAWREKQPEASWEDGVKALGLVRARLAGALAAGEAEAILEGDYRLSLRRRVQATPALVIANRMYEGESARLQLMRVLCGLLDQPRPDVCQTVPACFNDAQCRRRGVIGRCLDSGTPQARCDQSQKAVRVPMIILTEKNAIYQNQERIVETLLNWLPGLEWRVLDPGDGEGRALTEHVKPDRFPAYLIDPIAKTELDYQMNLSDVMETRGDWLVLKPSASGASRIVARNRLPHHADLFVSRFSRVGQEAVDVALNLPEWRAKLTLTIRDALYLQDVVQPDGSVKRELASRNGQAELQEAAIAAAVRRIAPGQFERYLIERGKRRGSLFWDRAVEAVGLDANRVRALVEGPGESGIQAEIQKDLEAEATLLNELKTGGDVVLLAENCELVPVHSRQELAYYLERIAHQSKDKRP